MRILIFSIICFSLLCCNQTKNKTLNQQYTFDLQGHRGCRGLLPENTIPAFKKAVELGVTTLELDVVISKDEQVIVSHEPFFHHHITTLSDGTLLTEENEKKHKVFEKTYAEIKEYDVGLKPHPNFKDQNNLAVHKPSLVDMVKAIEPYAKSLGKADIRYNIELKRRPEWDNSFLPSVNNFVDLVLNTVKQLGIADRTTLQCFDIETLQILKAKETSMPLVYLVANQNTIEKNIELLGFAPDIYSPHFKMVNHPVVDYCKKNEILLVPWTVNETVEMKRLIQLKVDGIITDYPDRLISLVENTVDVGIK